MSPALYVSVSLATCGGLTTVSLRRGVGLACPVGLGADAAVHRGRGRDRVARAATRPRARGAIGADARPAEATRGAYREHDAARMIAYHVPTRPFPWSPLAL